MNSHNRDLDELFRRGLEPYAKAAAPDGVWSRIVERAEGSARPTDNKIWLQHPLAQQLTVFWELLLNPNYESDGQQAIIPQINMLSHQFNAIRLLS
jgi:hypothetical protein